MAGNLNKNVLKLIPPAIIFILPAVVFSIFSSLWSAKKEVQASREGRQESMNKDLASAKQFAILDEQQQKQVEKIAQTIDVSKKDAKKIINSRRGLGIVSSIKTIFKKDEDEKYTANIKMNTNTLTQEEILEAKKDKDLVQNIVEKIDIASQDYAENAELVVGAATTIATSGGVLTGFLANFVASKIKPLAKYSKMLSVLLGATISLGSIIFGAKIQKQASRVGRFKAKQELLNNPQQLVYVDENKYKDINTIENKKNKKGFIETTKELIVDNKKYNDYLKENNAKNIQIRKAKEQIELTPEQEQRAKMLQENTFNMFNKLDEKSQRYSESTEAIETALGSAITSLISLPGMFIGMTATLGAKSKQGKVVGLLAYLGSLIVPITLNSIVTKEQKNASRVANMRAIEELNDYRYFAQNIGIKNDSEASNKTPFDDFLKKNPI